MSSAPFATAHTTLVSLLVASAALGCASRAAPPPAASPALAPSTAAPPAPVKPSANLVRAREIVARMTLEEKAAALVHVWDWSRQKTPAELCAVSPLGAGSFERLGQYRSPADTVRFVEDVRACTREASRLGIPPFIVDEGVHGFMQQGATSFPAAIALGATWDPALIERVFTVVAHEARARGTSWILGPNLDLAREPRWGRTDEMYGEDPYHVAQLGLAAIQGLQGRTRPIASDRVLATAKHFAAHGQPESGANGGPAHVGERALRGEYFVPFETAVKEGQVGAVMAAYNEIDGVPGHVNGWLFEHVLRGEWGFGGFVTADGMGVERLVTVHHVAATPAEAARRALGAGIDYEIGNTFRELVGEVTAGRVSAARLDEAVTRVLLAKLELGLFDAAPLDPATAERVNNSPEHQQVALEAARAGAVLLENDGLLPLDRSRMRRIAVLGPNAERAHLGSYSVDPGRGVSLLDGVRALAGKTTEVRYARGCNITAEDLTWEGHWKNEVKLPDPKVEQRLLEEAVRTARGADVAIIALGENEQTSRETWDNHLGDRDSLTLLGRQDELVRAVAATGVPIVLVLVNGRPLEIGAALAHSRAAIEAFYLGQETGTALAEILFGDVAPTGHLPVSYPRSVGQLPIYYYAKPSARGPYLFADHGPLFPFGWGLTYTTFEHGTPEVTPAKIRPGERARVTVSVANTGSRRGTDVVQLYVGKTTSSVTRPVRLLRGFARVELAPGEARTVAFEVGPDDLRYFDTELRPRVEAGTYRLEVGSNSADLRETTLEVEGPAP